jgi:hypothetical protein
VNLYIYKVGRSWPKLGWNPNKSCVKIQLLHGFYIINLVWPPSSHQSDRSTWRAKLFEAISLSSEGEIKCSIYEIWLSRVIYPMVNPNFLLSNLTRLWSDRLGLLVWSVCPDLPNSGVNSISTTDFGLQTDFIRLGYLTQRPAPSVIKKRNQFITF